MSYSNPRISLEDSTITMLSKMAEGNIGAVNVLMQLLKEGDKIDPDAAAGGFMSVLDLDTLDIYGSHIWVLYKDVCGSRIDRVIALLRAYQLGFISGEAVTAAATDPRRETKLDVEGLLVKVKERLPAFNATP